MPWDALPRWARISSCGGQGTWGMKRVTPGARGHVDGCAHTACRQQHFDPGPIREPWTALRVVRPPFYTQEQPLSATIPSQELPTPQSHGGVSLQRPEPTAPLVRHQCVT